MFDGACGFCTWCIRFARQCDVERRFTFAPYQVLSDDDFDGLRLNPARCAGEVQLVDAHGTVYGGADAINTFVSLLPGPQLASILIVPLFQHVALLIERRIYRCVATRRQFISHLLNTGRFALPNLDRARIRLSTERHVRLTV